MTARPAPSPSASHCPLCGQANRCAMELERETGVAQGPCWCTTESFPQTLLDQIPSSAQGKACICQACLHAKGVA